MYSLIHPLFIHPSSLSYLPFICPLIHPPIHLTFFQPSIHHLSIHPSIHSFIYIVTRPFIYPYKPTILSTIHSFTHPFISPFIHAFITLLTSIYSFIHPSIYNTHTYEPVSYYPSHCLFIHLSVLFHPPFIFLYIY